MKSIPSNVINQLTNTNSLVALVSGVLWILCSWLISDQLLTLQMTNLLQDEKQGLNRQIENESEVIRQHFQQLHGISQVVAQDEAIINSLVHSNLKVASPAVASGQRKSPGVGNPQLIAINKYLAQVAAALGVQVVYVMDADGYCMASSNADKVDSFVGVNFGQREHFKMARSTGSGHQYAVGAVSNIPGFYLSTSIVKNGHIIGVATVKLNVSNLATWINQADAFVSDKFGIIIHAGDKALEMRSLPDSRIADLTDTERLARYKRKDFSPLDVQQWPAPDLPDLKYFEHEYIPLMLANRHISSDDIDIHVVRRVPSAASFAQNRIWLFSFVSLFGVAIILAIRLRIDSFRKHKIVENIRRESMQNLQMLSDRAPGFMFEYQLRPDGSSCFPYASQAMFEIFRIRSEEVRADASKFFNILHPDDAAEFVASIQASAKEQTLWSCEYRVIFEDGTVRWMLGNASPMRQMDRSVLWHGFMMDITERKDTDQALRDGIWELQLKDFALNAAANAVVITDTQGRIEWANTAFSQLSGYSPSESQGQILGDLVKSGLQPKEFYEQLWQSVLKRESWRGELLNRRKDRSLYWEEMSISPVSTAADHVQHFVVVKQDISQRKAMERDLRDAKENMQRLLDSMAEGVFELDVLGKIVFVNRAFLEMLGYQDVNDVIGKSIHLLLQHTRANGKQYPVDASNILLVIKTHQPINAAHEIFWRQDDTAISVEYWVQPNVMDGVVVGVTGTFIDISKRFLLERERDKMSEQLLHQNRLLQEHNDHIKEEESTARDFIKQFSALDKISDPLVQFMLKPADIFSGDMIAFARTPDNRLHVLLADSAGHGLTAALAVIPITQPFYQMTAKGFDIPAIAKEMNRRVRNYLPLPRYVACVLLSLDTESQMLQVWNGGCPPVLLLTSDGKEFSHQFASNNLPLGVVKPEMFSPSIEYLKCEDKSCQLLLCTDGATDLFIDHKGSTGHDEMLEMANQAQAPNFFERLVEAINTKVGINDYKDDIGIVVVHCESTTQVKNIGIDNAASNEGLQKQYEDIDFELHNELVWEYKMTLFASQLKHLDVVPFLIGITSQIDGGRADSKIFLVLSELFNNAFDHGVLKLSSSLKHKAEDMDAFYVERAVRMTNLEFGKIEIQLDMFRGNNIQIMKIYMKDSGDGFDFDSVVDQIEMTEKRIRHGRGIPLLRATCNALQYLGNGSEVIAYIELPITR
jgi:PAS domain S-box-containing protein